MPHTEAYLTSQTCCISLEELNIPSQPRIYQTLREPRHGQTRMSAAKLFAEAASTAGSSLRREHVLHVFPSFGIGGVPLRMVRIINHLGKRFRHTVIALDNNFDAAEGVASDLDIAVLPIRGAKRGMLHNLACSTLALRRLRPDLLL